MPFVESTADTARSAAPQQRRYELLDRLGQRSADSAAIARARAIADIVAELTENDDILAGALLFPLLEARAIAPDDAQAFAGHQSTREFPRSFWTSFGRVGWFGTKRMF